MSMSTTTETPPRTLTDRIFAILTDGKGNVAGRLNAIRAHPLDTAETHKLLQVIRAMGKRLDDLQSDRDALRARLDATAEDVATLATAAASLAQAAEWARRSIGDV
jgi:hypothetical protein